MRGLLIACLVLPCVVAAVLMAPDLANQLRIKIRRLMEEHGITQAELATRLEVSRPRISQILKSSRDLQATLTVDRLEILADTFGMSAPALLLGESEAQEALTGDERSLIELFRLLPETQRGNLLAMLTYIFEPRRAANAERRALALLRASMARTLAEPPSRSSKRLG